ncbi:MFS general substrate transporter [Mycena venus]|uniref:MFS general substrate transporter n=1 Tax=Mycena venus TaxID=2733690 RepID=A0A8H6YX53_9AGAR|nr:MFS general substrate transporter [Mycena venus]
MSIYTILHLGQALAKNIEIMLITRFPGLIADIWNVEKRGTAVSPFAPVFFSGLVIMGPIASGCILESSLNWRWIFWVMMMFAGACTVLMILTLPETYAPIILLKKVKALRKADPAENKHLFAAHEKQDCEPILVLITVYMSLIYGVLYALFRPIPIIFVERRGFSIAQTGLIFVGVGIGTTIEAALNVYLSRYYPELIKTWRGFPPPEKRLLGAMVGHLLARVDGPISRHPVVCACAQHDRAGHFRMYSASAFAAKTVIRSLVAAAFPLFTFQLFTKFGVNWAAMLLGCIGLLLPSPFLFYKYGALIRTNSKFAPCIDPKIAKVLAQKAETSMPTVSLVEDPGTADGRQLRRNSLE